MGVFPKVTIPECVTNIEKVHVHGISVCQSGSLVRVEAAMISTNEGKRKLKCMKHFK